MLPIGSALRPFRSSSYPRCDARRTLFHVLEDEWPFFIMMARWRAPRQEMPRRQCRTFRRGRRMFAGRRGSRRPVAAV